MKAKIKTIKMLKPALKSLLLVPAVLALAGFTAQTTLTDKRQGELLYILEQDCGSCHGLTLKGGLGPALTPQHLQGRSADDLTLLILDGVPGTPMPPWRPLLSEQEVLFMVNVLQSGDMVK